MRRTRAKAPVGGMPAVRAEAGQWGMLFRFGGLAALTHAGNTRPVGSTVMTHVGLKKVLSENWMVPFYFGMSLGMRSPENLPSSTDFGFEGGGGIEYHFRIWRRISPFIGATAGLFYVNPAGDDNWTLGFGVGPQVGVEYYIADRLSLTAMYMFSINLAVQKSPGFPDSTTTTGFGMETLAGGALTMTYYF
ncbi:MAG: hypothetical protein JRH20_20345 [Deltaproteobacteria bacterium]|nr:hypothetical protein [Deltaproteobacteria bacterium]